MAKVVTCPYCWRVERIGNLNLACGESCGDDATTFPARQAVKGRCPHGRAPLPRRFCPGEGCGRMLLREYVESDGHRIAVIGSTSAGKSVYVSVLLTELAGRVSTQFNGMALDLLGETSRKLHRTACTELYERRSLLSPTPVRHGRANPLDPLIFTLKIPSTSWWGGRRVTSILSVVYDSAGEYVLREDNIHLLIDYLDTASGILLLIDPMRFVKVAEQIRRARPEVPGDARAMNQKEVLERLAELLRERRGVRRLDTPLAVALSKVDLLEDTFGEQVTLFAVPAHQGCYDDVDGRTVHEEIRSWLDRWDGPGLDHTVAANFTTYRYFGFSALGGQPAADRTIGGTGINPHRVEDPVLWLLARFGAVKSNRGRR